MSQKKISAALDHLNFTVTHFQDSANWYKDVFGFEVVEQGKTAEGKPWGILRSNDCMLCIYEEKNRLPSPEEDNSDFAQYHRISHFGLRITDRVQWENILKEKQLKVFYGGPIQYPFSTSWYIQDPSGHEIEVAFWNENQVRFT